MKYITHEINPLYGIFADGKARVYKAVDNLSQKREKDNIFGNGTVKFYLNGLHVD